MHSFAPYSIRIYDSALAGPREERYHRLDSVRGLDLLNELEAFCNANSSAFLQVEEEKSKKAIKTSDVTLESRELFGFIEFGEYGMKGKVVDVASNNTVYAKKAGDSDVHQLYFHFLVPKERKNALCIFHNIHGRGVKGIFEGIFNEYFQTKSKGLRLQIHPLSYDKVVQDWMDNATVKELRLQKFTPKNELKDAVAALDENVINITLKPKNKGGSFGSFLEFYQGNNIKGSKRGAIEILGNECHAVKALVEHNGKKRVFSLAANSTPISSIEFDEEDVAMDDGAPKFDALKTYGRTLLADLLDTM